MLTEKLIRSLEPKEKDYLIHDARGLYILVRPTGGKVWRFKYRVDGKEIKKSFGTWPEVSLKEAREERDSARVSLRKTGKIHIVKKEKAGFTFQTAYSLWLQKEKIRWSKDYFELVDNRFKNHVLPYIGRKTLNDITTPDILTDRKSVV